MFIAAEAGVAESAVEALETSRRFESAIYPLFADHTMKNMTWRKRSGGGEPVLKVSTCQAIRARFVSMRRG
jgi:hypothetical protein